MKAIEVTGLIDEKGNLSLNHPVPAMEQGQVRVIILYPELSDQTESDPDNMSKENVEQSLRRALQDATSGQRLPLSQMWEGVEQS